MAYNIYDPNYPGTKSPVWLVAYDNQTGLVTDTSVDENTALDLGSEAAQTTAIELINSNSSNTFIGHVPPPHH